MSNKECTLFEGSREGVEPRLKGGYLSAPFASREALWCTLFEGSIVGRGVPHRLIKELIMGL